jgi:hypothetical protein
MTFWKRKTVEKVKGVRGEGRMSKWSPEDI